MGEKEKLILLYWKVKYNTYFEIIFLNLTYFKIDVVYIYIYIFKTIYPCKQKLYIANNNVLCFSQSQIILELVLLIGIFF